MTDVTPPSPGAAPDDEDARKRDQLRLAEKRLRDEIARHRKAEEDERRKVRLGCTAIIVALALALVAGFVFF